MNHEAIDPDLRASLPSLTEYDISQPELARAQWAASRTQIAARTPIHGPVQRTTRAIRTHPGPGPELRLHHYATPEHQPRGALLWIHGGGFVFGEPEADEPDLVHLAEKLDAVVIAPAYRLAPEHPYPAALDDCWHTLEWISAHAREHGIDHTRIVVGGESSGACLAAGVALRARDRGGPALALQFLETPVLDDRLTTPSMHEFDDTPQWTRSKAAVSWHSYLADTTETDQYAAPARAQDLRGLPPTYISVASQDPLRDEALDYGLRLTRAGVTTELHLFPGTFHGSRHLGHARISRRQSRERIDVLQRALNPDLDPRPETANTHTTTPTENEISVTAL